MPTGASIFCIALGAILTFAVETDSTSGIDVDNVGIILMVVGVIGLVAYYAVWAPRTRQVATPVVRVVDDRPVTRVVSQPVVSQPVVEQPVVEQPVVEQRVARPAPVVERTVHER